MGITQVKVKTFEQGNRAKINVKLYDETGSMSEISLPNKIYTLMYKYDWDDDKGDADGHNRIEKIERMIEKIIKVYKLTELKVWCYSLTNSPGDFKTWLDIVQKRKPFKVKPGYEVSYFNSKEDNAEIRVFRRQFDKLVLVDPKGKVLVSSGSISNFTVSETEQKPVKTTLIHGKFLGEKEGVKKPLQNTMIFLYNAPEEDTVAKTFTDNFGDFVIPLPDDEKSTYQLKVGAVVKTTGKVIMVNVNGVEMAEAEGKEGEFKFEMIKAVVTGLTDVTEEDVTLAYQAFKKSGKKDMRVSGNITYDFSKFDLEKQKTDVLEKVISILKENPALKLQVISHTDSQGDDHTNLLLSEKRSQTVVEYLISKGIAKKRLKAIGKGEKEIRNRCANGVECSDKEHEFNRRTEFNFIK